jgi:hypothetical protein
LQLEALVPVTLNPTFNPKKHLGPNSLRAGVTAPQSTGEGGEQRQSEQDEKPGYGNTLGQA